MRHPPAGIALLAATALAATASPAAAQGRCTLRITSERSTSRAVGGDAFVHYAGGNVVTRCGDATITADSAEHYEREGRVEMIGRVAYRDTTRTLSSETLTFFGPRDRIVAQGDVHLVRLRTGATLDGPRVEFSRTERTSFDRTVATGRPRMTLRSRPEAEPFVVDADTAVFEGEERARASGTVEIHRADLDATSDSARFDVRGGDGRLYGSPVVRGEGWELRGDSIRAGFEAEELRTVHALGAAEAEGESFELRGPQVRARIADGEVERMFAYGEGRSIGRSERFHLAGDSLEFALVEGRLDSLVAVGGARAVEAAPGAGVPPGTEPSLVTEAGTNWVVGDTIRAAFETVPSPAPDRGPERTGEEAVAGGDTVPDGAEPEAPRSRPRHILARGEARSFYAAVRDTARAERPSRNYLVGREIEVFFEAGEATRVEGRDAVGIFLEPAAEGAGRSSGETSAGEVP